MEGSLHRPTRNRMNLYFYLKHDKKQHQAPNREMDFS